VSFDIHMQWREPLASDWRAQAEELTRQLRVGNGDGADVLAKTAEEITDAFRSALAYQGPSAIMVPNQKVGDH
jgi:hypothetical protein